MSEKATQRLQQLIRELGVSIADVSRRDKSMQSIPAECFPLRTQEPQSAEEHSSEEVSSVSLGLSDLATSTTDETDGAGESNLLLATLLQ